MSHIMTGILLLAAVLLSAGCGSSGESAPAALGLQGRTWLLADLSGNPIEAITGRRTIYIEFSADSAVVNGFTGCNNLGGTYYLSADTLVFGQLFSTRMACEGEMETEAALLRALESTIAFEKDGENLVLLGAKGELARFRPDLN